MYMSRCNWVVTRYSNVITGGLNDNKIRTSGINGGYHLLDETPINDCVLIAINKKWLFICG